MFRDQRDDVHKSFGRLVGIFREVRNFIQRQDVIDLPPLYQWTRRVELIVILSPIFLYLQNHPTQLLTMESLNSVGFLLSLVQGNVPECRRSARYRILNNSNGLDFEAMRLDPLSKFHFMAVTRDVGHKQFRHDNLFSPPKKNASEHCAGQECVRADQNRSSRPQESPRAYL